MMMFGAEQPKFLGQFAGDIQLHGEQARSHHRRAADHRDQRHRQPPAIAAKEFPEQAAKHYSPFRIGAGSKCAARRKGIKPPTRATSAASPENTGSQERIAATRAYQIRSRPGCAQVLRRARIRSRRPQWPA